MGAVVSSREKARKAWSDRTTLATPLVTLFIDSYGLEALEWDPETIQLEIQDDFQVVLPAINMDKLMMAILVVTTDRFRQSLPDFINVCNVFSGSSFDPNEFDPADAVECAWGITEAVLLDPPEDDDEEIFAEEIRAYVGQVVDAEGLINPPDVLQIGIRASGNQFPGGDFADDPVLFESIWKTEKSKSDDIRQRVRTRLAAMVQQIQELPLTQGKTEGLVAKMRKTLPGGT